MLEFFTVLADPNVPFLRYALLVGLLSAIPFGIIGSYVVVRRISSLAGAISHCLLAGIGGGLYLERVVGWSYCGPVSGAFVVAVVAAAILAWAHFRAGQREDSVIGALWSVGMAIGLLFLAATPGYTDPMSYLFGNILLIGQSDMYFVLALDVVVLGLAAFFHPQFLALCFDDEFARLRGLPTNWLYFLLLCLTAMTIVLLVRVVGIVMVIALLTLPAAIAGNFASGIGGMMVGAVLACASFIFCGMAISYSLDLPTGPVIICLAALTYLITSLKSSIR
ncbi:MAG: metal ABC transporter permease [Desulfobulbaceae bacterium]|jgi:zinc transport system permease protein|nr:metal ABC transporter permease [Desulfobulbaceae bacterium]